MFDVERLSTPVTRCAIDSGGFTELQMFGRWTVPAKQFVAECERFVCCLGTVDWIAQQDWMCEPIVISGGEVKTRWGVVKFVGTKLSVAKHQELTIDNYIELRALSPWLPFVPVIQGWERDDYLRHIDAYYKRGIRLHELPVVGVGSVCRRQGTEEATRIMCSIAAQGLPNLHAFGFKRDGVIACKEVIDTADSLWWSYVGRGTYPCPFAGHDRPGPGRRGHQNAAHCADFALAELESLLADAGLPHPAKNAF